CVSSRSYRGRIPHGTLRELEGAPCAVRPTDGPRRASGLVTLRLLIVAAAMFFAGALPSLAFNGYRQLQLGGDTVKWGAPSIGSGATVTYAVVAEDVGFPGARNCAAMVPPTALLRRSGIEATA